MICIYHIKNVEISQEPPMLAVALSDKGRNGRERPWRAYKMANEILSMAYESINPRKAERLKWCCKTIEADCRKLGAAVIHKLEVRQGIVKKALTCNI